LPAPIKPRPRKGLGFIIVEKTGIEPIAVQGSGGALLTPVQKLVSTTIFFRRAEENAHRFRLPAPRSHLDFDRVRVGFFFYIFDELPIISVFLEQIAFFKFVP